VTAPSSPRGRVMLAGGGTAGHVVPALAIADALVARGWAHDAIVMAGSSTGQETVLVPERGYALITQPLVNLRRRPNGVGDVPSWAWRAVRAVTSLVAATATMWRRFAPRQSKELGGRPSVVVSVGGYASVPAVVAARLRRIPIVVVSYDAVPGAASRWSARVATVSAVAFSTSTLARRVVTGAPVRAEVLAVDRVRDRAAARVALAMPADGFVVVSVGGSLGAGIINEVMTQLAHQWSGRDDVFIHHIVGQRNAGTVVSQGSHHQVVPFESRMDLCYAAADCLVARAGAATIAEIGAVGIASIVVPWSGAANNHQAANAASLSNDGGAILVTDEQCTALRIGDVLQQWQNDPAAADAIGRQAGHLGHRDGAPRIAGLIDDVVNGRPIESISS
jgi:UDP-N-acetylglucosamine--N-acetylmuramyl-(pentapeptide) pyrophosphoryl-undecaprenol N-acetylglucosamine transferase